MIIKNDKKYDSVALGLLLIDDMLSDDDELNYSDWKRENILYACNKENNGMVIAIAFTDGFYIYSVDENGNKVNESEYIFPDSKTLLENYKKLKVK